MWPPEWEEEITERVNIISINLSHWTQSCSHLSLLALNTSAQTDRVRFSVIFLTFLLELVDRWCEIHLDDKRDAFEDKTWIILCIENIKNI